MAAGHKKAGDAAEKQAKQVKSLADADADYQKSRERMSRAMQDANNTRAAVDRTGPRFNATDEAMRRVNKADQDAAVRREMQRLGHGQAGAAGPLRMLAPLLGAEAIGRGVSNLGAGLSEAASSEGGLVNLGSAADRAARSFVEGLPVIGGFVKGIREAGSALSGYTQSVADAARFTETATRMNAAQSQINAVNRAARSEMFGFGRTALDAQIGAESARGFAGFVAANPNVRGSQLDVERARFGVSEAAALAEQRQRELNTGLPSGMSAADRDALIAERERAAATAGSRVSTLQRAIQGAQGFGALEEPLRAGLADAQADAKIKEDQAIEARRMKESDIAALKERQKAANEANLNLAQRQYDLSKAEAAIQQDKLDKMKSLAQTLGGAQAGEGEEALRILRAIEQGGVGSVSPEEASFASRFAPQFVQQQQINAGQNNPLFQQFQQFTQGSFSAGGQIGELEASLNAANAQAIADLKQAQAAANKQFVTDITAAIIEANKLTATNIRAEAQVQMQQGAIQRAASGG